MATKTGSFIISLDFELMWGVRDEVTKATYGQHILGVHQVIPRLLATFAEFKIKATFAAVGFLFLENKEAIIKATPPILPSYFDRNLSPYGEYLEHQVGIDSTDDPYHFGWPLLKMIRADGNHEIGTHTFSHYYCLEKGQTAEQYREDLKAALKAGIYENIDIKTIIFPRNQVNPAYLEVCKEMGIKTYRGTEQSWIYSAKSSKDEKLLRRLIRLLDAYLNLSGHHCFRVDSLAQNNTGGVVNIPSSRFLRPYSKGFRIFEPLRLARIKKSMTYAARNNFTYHLWWHPHNFGINQDQNFSFLKEILMHYQYLNAKYSFTNLTMDELSRQHNESQ